MTDCGLARQALPASSAITKTDLRVVGKRLNRRAVLWLIGLAIGLVAITLRLYAIDRLPPGLFGDEAVEGLDALDVLAGNLAIWFPAHFGREPIYVYLVALSYRAFGVSALSTRLPAIIAGLLTIPATFLFVREWARQVIDERRALRIAIIATSLISISFWHIQMTRDAHRDTLLPLVEAVGFFFLWRARRTASRVNYGAAGLVLGLAIYTYSPGRFVGVLVALAVGLELLVSLVDSRQSATVAGHCENETRRTVWTWHGTLIAGALALAVMLPLLVYFAANPSELTRRFESVSVFDTDSPAATLATSVSGNLAQLVVPGAGYQSKHYNLPGKPIFDLLLAPWFLVGLGMALWRFRRAEYRFLVLWFVVMLVPAFLTADMIPKGVRALGIVPGVFVFPALAMDALWSRSATRHALATALIAVSVAGSALWTAYDYFVAWANLPDLPLAFDTDLAEVSDLIRRQPAGRRVYISTEVYRPPTEMLLGRLVPTTRYVDPATNVREFNATSSLVLAQQADVLHVFVRDQKPDTAWLARLAQDVTATEEGTYYSAYQLSRFSSPAKPLENPVTPYLTLIGYSLYEDEPGGIALYWKVNQVAAGREDFQEILSLRDGSGNVVTQDARRFPVTPLEWSRGDTIVEWRTIDFDKAQAVQVELSRGKERWQTNWSIEKQSHE